MSTIIKKKLSPWVPPKESWSFRIVAKILITLTAVGMWILMKVLNKTKFYGAEIIAREKGPYVFASNHTTMFDSGFIDAILFLKKGIINYNNFPYHTPEYGNFYKTKILSWFMNHVKCIPLERGKGIDQPSQKLVTQKLLEGKSVHIFPEGTRSRSGELLPAKAGVGKRIYESKVRVIPCYHRGMREMLRVGTTIPKIGNKIDVIIGEPITFDEFFEKENHPATWKAISEKIMVHIKMLKDELENKK